MILREADDFNSRITLDKPILKVEGIGEGSMTCSTLDSHSILCRRHWQSWWHWYSGKGWLEMETGRKGLPHWSGMHDAKRKYLPNSWPSISDRRRRKLMRFPHPFFNFHLVLPPPRSSGNRLRRSTLSPGSDIAVRRLAEQRKTIAEEKVELSRQIKPRSLPRPT